MSFVSFPHLVYIVYQIFWEKSNFFWGKILGGKGSAEGGGKCGMPCLPQDNGLLYASYTLVFVPSRPSAGRGLRRNLVRNGSQLLHKFQRTRRDGPIAYIVRTNEVSPSDVFEPAEFASVFFFLFLCKKGERKKGSSECGPSIAAEARA